MMDKKRIAQLLEALGKGLFEKEHVLSLSLLAAVAGESIFLLGPPGTAKSMIARRLKSAFRDGRSFEYLMSRFSTPDEIFGPVSVSALKDEDRYMRMTEGYLPTADVVFLDEIWKAGPSIQNALLTVLNEKVYLNGKEEMRLPLKLVVAASNELPAEGENLDALWDRFLVRCVVGGIADKELFKLMISSTVQSEVEVPDVTCVGRRDRCGGDTGLCIFICPYIPQTSDGLQCIGRRKRRVPVLCVRPPLEEDGTSVADFCLFERLFRRPFGRFASVAGLCMGYSGSGDCFGAPLDRRSCGSL